jgi:transcriptional regulator with XRE-family HTH domain
MHSLGRRLRAARLLGGFSTQAALADALDLRGLHVRNIRDAETNDGRLESGRLIAPHELEAIARACGIDVAFFELDLADLSEQRTLARLLREGADRLDRAGADLPAASTDAAEMVREMERARAETTELLAGGTAPQGPPATDDRSPPAQGRRKRRGARAPRESS